MGIRRRSRELAMQALYFMDMRGASKERLTLFCRCIAPSKKTHSFFVRMVNGVLANYKEIDAVIERFSSNWKISRMSCVDRNVLRVGIFELLYCEDIPVKVSINEAIDIGKKFGTEESGAFVNGILDSVRLAMDSGKIVCRPPSDSAIDPWAASDEELNGFSRPLAAAAPGEAYRDAPPEDAISLPSRSISPGVRKRLAVKTKLPI